MKKVVKSVGFSLALLGVAALWSSSRKKTHKIEEIKKAVNNAADLLCFCGYFGDGEPEKCDVCHMYSMVMDAIDHDDSSLLPAVNCCECVYMFLPNDGGHCYMFRNKPGDKCAQFREMKTNEVVGRNEKTSKETQKHFANMVMIEDNEEGDEE